MWCRTTWEDSSHNNTTIPVDILRQSPDACVGNALPAREWVSPVCVGRSVCVVSVLCVCVCVL